MDGTAGADALVAQPGAATMMGAVSGRRHRQRAGPSSSASRSPTAPAGVSVTTISIALRAGGDTNAEFNTTGGELRPDAGRAAGLACRGRELLAGAGQADRPDLTISFTPGSSPAATRCTSASTPAISAPDRTGAAFARSGVKYTVTYSDGARPTVIYGNNGANGSAATAVATLNGSTA